MRRKGAISDLVGKLTVLRSECEKYGRSGQYRLGRLIMCYGIDAKLFDCSDEITADCPPKRAMNLSDTRGTRCPDLPRWCESTQHGTMLLTRLGVHWVISRAAHGMRERCDSQALANRFQ
jgi:hypothetical protein